MHASNLHVTATDREIARLFIDSREKAEEFIEKYMRHHHVGRRMAVIRLRQLGINISKLPFSQTIALQRNR